MSGRGHRRKGNRIEREIVERHRQIGVRAERYPLSGASHFRGSAHDVDIYPGGDIPPLKAEIKARNDGQGFTLLEKWLADYDILFLRRDGADPLVVLPWEVYVHLLLRSHQRYDADRPSSTEDSACSEQPSQS